MPTPSIDTGVSAGDAMTADVEPRDAQVEVSDAAVAAPDMMTPDMMAPANCVEDTDPLPATAVVQIFP